MPMIFALIRRRLADERGFTMVTVMGVLLVATLFSVAAIAAADRDIPQSRTDLDRKQAYAAAEAGINDYMARLNQDSNYWTNCDNVKAPAPVNQQFVRTSPTQADPRKWRRLPGSTDADYTIELIPAPGKSRATRNDPAGSMINPNTQGFTIRATGRSRPNGRGTGGSPQHHHALPPPRVPRLPVLHRPRDDRPRVLRGHGELSHDADRVLQVQAQRSHVAVHGDHVHRQRQGERSTPHE